MGKYITTLNELREFEDNENVYYVRNNKGVICGVRDKDKWKFYNKCRYYKMKFKSKKEFMTYIEEQKKELEIVVNYLYPEEETNGQTK